MGVPRREAALLVGKVWNVGSRLGRVANAAQLLFPPVQLGLPIFKARLIPFRMAKGRGMVEREFTGGDCLLQILDMLF